MNPFTKRRKSRFAFIATCLLALFPAFAGTNIVTLSPYDGRLEMVSKINRTFRQLENVYSNGVGVVTNSATNFVLRTGGDIYGALSGSLGKLKFVSGTATISNAAFGASQFGRTFGTMDIGAAFGAAQHLEVEEYAAIAAGAHGAQQLGYSGESARMAIGPNGIGAAQLGQVIGSPFAASATNNGVGSVQLLDLSSGQHAYIGANAALGLGAVTVTNQASIVAEGRIVAQDGFYGTWKGNGITTNLAAGSFTNLVISNGLIIAVQP